MVGSCSVRVVLVIEPAKREELKEIVKTYNYQDVPFRFLRKTE